MITSPGDHATHSLRIEADLVDLAKSGDRGAFSELVRIHRAGVINVVYRLCGDGQLAEDAAQDAFIKTWVNLHRYKPKSPFRNWIYRIATNTALDVLRRQHPTADIQGMPLKSTNIIPENAAEAQERSDLVRAAVLDLSPASRSVLVLREYEGLSYKEIADTLAIPIGTVMSRLNYARNQLRRSLANYLEVS